MAVLIVDDEGFVALELAAALEHAGFRVRGPAVSCHEALSLARGCAPWLALVSIGLVGEMDGVQLARALREAYGTKCLFLTALPERALAGRDAAVGFIEKPYPTALVVRVVRALDASARGEERPTRPGSVHWLA